MPLVVLFLYPVAMTMLSWDIVAWVLVRVALLFGLSSRIWPRASKFPDFSWGNVRANLPAGETFGRCNSLFAVDVMVWLFGRWTVMGGNVVWNGSDGKSGLM